LSKNNFKNPPNPIENLLEEIGEVYEGNDWLIIKKYLLRYSHPELRKKFSTRNQKTRKHTINDYEQDLIDKYYKIFNIKLVLDEDKKHKEN